LKNFKILSLFLILALATSPTMFVDGKSFSVDPEKQQTIFENKIMIEQNDLTQEPKHNFVTLQESVSMHLGDKKENSGLQNTQYADIKLNEDISISDISVDDAIIVLIKSAADRKAMMERIFDRSKFNRIVFDSTAYSVEDDLSLDSLSEKPQSEDSHNYLELQIEPGVEELSTLNVGGSKNAGMRMGPTALGTPLLQINSANVCGDTLCDTPMSIEEKIQMYLEDLRKKQEAAGLRIGFGGIVATKAMETVTASGVASRTLDESVAVLSLYSLSEKPQSENSHNDLELQIEQKPPAFLIDFSVSEKQLELIYKNIDEISSQLIVTAVSVSNVNGPIFLLVLPLAGFILIRIENEKLDFNDLKRVSCSLYNFIDNRISICFFKFKF